MTPTGDRLSIRRFFPYLRPHVAVLTVLAALSLVQSGAMLAQPLLLRDVIDSITTGEPVATAVVVLVALLGAIAGLSAVRGYLLQRAGESIVLGVRRRLARHILRLPIAEYDRRRTGDLLSRVGSDTTVLRIVVTSGFLELGSGLVMTVAAATVMITVDATLFLVTFVVLVLALSTAVVMSRRIQPLARAMQERLGELTAAVERAITGARTVRAARAEDREEAVVAGFAQRTFDQGLRIARLQAQVGPVATFASQGTFLVVLGVGGARVAGGSITVGDLVAFVLFLFILIMPLERAVTAYTQLQAGLGAVHRIEEILALPTEADLDGGPVEEVPLGEPGAIALRGVSFGYTVREPVLDDVSLTIPAGTRAALVGPSGAGKSTVLALLERFYDADAGSVLLGGRDVRTMPRGQLRSQLAYVEQEAPVLAGTIRDNLLLADAAADDAQLHAALDAVNLGYIATRGTRGLDEQVGEGGVLLSGGERQRLAIARALLAGAPVLLMDEPTSQLDGHSEAILHDVLQRLPAGQTVLTVAHRLATVVDADQIIVLERGRVVGRGRHEELLETTPLYRDLVARQLVAHGPAGRAPAVAANA